MAWRFGGSSVETTEPPSRPNKYTCRKFALYCVVKPQNPFSDSSQVQKVVVTGLWEFHVVWRCLGTTPKGGWQEAQVAGSGKAAIFCHSYFSSFCCWKKNWNGNKLLKWPLSWIVWCCLVDFKVSVVLTSVARFESVSSLENELEIRPPKQSLRTIQRCINWMSR